MAKAADHPHQFVSRISLVGRSLGRVKTLAGFKKQHHTVPDSVNAVTTAFLGKLCSSELAAEGEQFFQRAKEAMGYLRKDLSLEVTSPSAVLTAKDFTLEIAYALQSADPADYEITRTLHSLRSGELVSLPEFNDLFASLFGGIVFGLTKGARVEAVIDAVEEKGGAGGLTVSYPSDYRHCVLAVEGVAAEVVCDGATLHARYCMKEGYASQWVVISGQRNQFTRLVEKFAAVTMEITLFAQPRSSLLKKCIGHIA